MKNSRKNGLIVSVYAGAHERYPQLLALLQLFFKEAAFCSLSNKNKESESGGMCSVQEFSSTLVAQPSSGRGQ